MFRSGTSPKSDSAVGFCNRGVLCEAQLRALQDRKNSVGCKGSAHFPVKIFGGDSHFLPFDNSQDCNKVPNEPSQCRTAP